MLLAHGGCHRDGILARWLPIAPLVKSFAERPRDRIFEMVTLVDGIVPAELIRNACPTLPSPDCPCIHGHAWVSTECGGNEIR